MWTDSCVPMSMMKITSITNPLCWSIRTFQTPPPSRLGAPETATGASPAGLYAEPQMQCLPGRPCIGWNLQSRWCSEETYRWWRHHQLTLLVPQPSCGKSPPSITKPHCTKVRVWHPMRTPPTVHVHLQWARHEIADRLGLLMLKSAAKMLMLVFEGGRPSPNSPQVQAYDQAMGLCWAGVTSSMSSSAPGVSSQPPIGHWSLSP